MPFYETSQGQNFLKKYDGFISHVVKKRKSGCIEYFRKIFKLMKLDKRDDLVEYGLRKIKFYLILIGAYDDIVEKAILSLSEEQKESAYTYSVDSLHCPHEI